MHLCVTVLPVLSIKLIICQALPQEDDDDEGERGGGGGRGIMVLVLQTLDFKLSSPCPAQPQQIVRA